jgi:type VI secretion system secreted protein VgrG
MGASAKSGSPGSLVSPQEPKEALDADEADPGEVSQVKARQRETKSGKYGKQKVPPFQPPQTEEEKQVKKSWVAIKVVDKDGQPMPGEAYEIELPDGTVASGTTGDDGCARVEGIEPGNVKIRLPNRDKRAWKPK